LKKCNLYRCLIIAVTALLLVGITGCRDVAEEIPPPSGLSAEEEQGEKQGEDSEGEGASKDDLDTPEDDGSDWFNGEEWEKADEDGWDEETAGSNIEQESSTGTGTTPLPWMEMIEKLSFLESPIPGAKISTRDSHLPGAPRPYRSGTHEGLDYYNGYCGVEIYFGAPVYTAAEGTVVRVDHDYQELTREKREKILRHVKSLGYTPEKELDILRGRQVWILHRERVLTCYAHLDEVNEAFAVGDKVSRGDVLGTIGNSATSADVDGTQEDAHLHFEIWVDGHYLGEGLSPEKVRRLWQKVLLKH